LDLAEVDLAEVDPAAHTSLITHSINTEFGLSCRKPFVPQLINKPATRKRRILQMIRRYFSGIPFANGLSHRGGRSDRRSRLVGRNLSQ
jgi:hypothetical protein